MEAKMFCSKCGGADQTPDSYCRQCGEWLPDLASGSGGRFRRSTREQRVMRMRLMQFLSVGLSIASAIMILVYLKIDDDKQLLRIALVCGFVVAIYQIISLSIGYKVLTPKVDRIDEQATAIADNTQASQAFLQAADSTEFLKPDSVVENTTELLDRIPKRKSGGDRQ